MYLSYYKLNKKPFQINTDPFFFWLGEKHKEALSLFTYGVSSDKGFLLLTGDVGTGKTTLINAFVKSLGKQVIVARVSDPGLPRLGFLKYIAEMFKMETAFESKNEFLILFTGFLEQAYKDDKHVLLVIDEAQHLTDETLEEIRLLSNIEKQDKKLLNIFLVGQNEFNDTLNKQKNRALRQRLAINYTLYPFEPEETRACIGFRLSVAGATKEIFTPGAIDAIHSISKGFPRAVNIICDHALLLGYQKEQEIITEEIVHQCSKNLHTHLPPSDQHKNLSDSADHWLEDSEVPPLSIEAINRASQPLPELTIVAEKEPARKTRRYLVAVPLFIAALILFGIFGSKDGILDTISQFVANKYKETIASTVKEEGAVLPPTGNTQETKTPAPSVVMPETSTTSSAPVKTVRTQQKVTGQGADLLKTGQQEPQPKTAPEATLTVELPVSTEPENENNTASAREPSTAKKKVRTTKTEMMQLQPEPAVSRTTTETINDDFNKQAPQPRVPAASMAEEVEPSLPSKKMTTAPKEPAATILKAKPKAEEDPGAVIDWLLKSKKKD